LSPQPSDRPNERWRASAPQASYKGCSHGAYRVAAKFIEKTRDLYPSMIYTNVSFVGSTSLADELMLLGPRYANGVIVTQVVPAVDRYVSTILKSKPHLPSTSPGCCRTTCRWSALGSARHLGKPIQGAGQERTIH
jgi:branched-chain amino acid transport system substrate-binding protein